MTMAVASASAGASGQSNTGAWFAGVAEAGSEFRDPAYGVGADGEVVTDGTGSEDGIGEDTGTPIVSRHGWFWPFNASARLVNDRSRIAILSRILVTWATGTTAFLSDPCVVSVSRLALDCFWDSIPVNRFWIAIFAF
jgi:hypothetical protein